MSLKNPLPVGMVTEDKMICKLGLFCCACGLKVPEVCCNGTGKCLCCKNACSLPFSDTVKEPVCAICTFRIMPAPMGLGLPVSGGAPPAAEMAR